jgi:hypothetical protein
MARRLETDAKIALTKAGYVTRYRGYYLDVYRDKKFVEAIRCKGGTVDNEKVEALIAKVKK